MSQSVTQEQHLPGLKTRPCDNYSTAMHGFVQIQEAFTTDISQKKNKTQTTRHEADEVKLFPSNRSNGGGNKITTLEIQTFFQPLPDCSDKIHRTETPLVGTPQYED